MEPRRNCTQMNGGGGGSYIEMDKELVVKRINSWNYYLTKGK